MNTRRFPWSTTTFIQGNGFVLLRGANVTDARINQDPPVTAPDCADCNAQPAIEPDTAHVRRKTLRSLLPPLSVTGSLAQAGSPSMSDSYWDQESNTL